MKVRFWGVRGSIPVAGPCTARYGGASSCVEVCAEGGPPLILDAGTGARAAGVDLLRRRVGQVHVLFSHFHADHVFGLPFFAPLYSPSVQVEIGVPAYHADDARARVARYLNGVNHPVRLSDLPAAVQFRGLRPGRGPVELGPYRVQGMALNHPGGACGYRIEADGAAVCYITDTAPLARPGEGLVDGRAPPAPEARLLRLLEGADLVVMDTMFSFDEYLERMTWGHAYPEYGVALCQAAGARELALFHHAPEATDDALDRLGERWAARDGLGGLRVSLAAEGREVQIGPPSGEPR